MEANEVQEYCEEIEKGKSAHMFEVSFSISVLAVMVALATVMSHRAHTEAILSQARASDEWGLYQAKKIRQNSIQLSSDMLAIVAPSNAATTQKLVAYKAHTAKWDNDLAESEHTAHALEEKVERSERRASRFDTGEALLQIAVVLSSITLLTRHRGYWIFGLTLGAAGVMIAFAGFFMR